MARLLPPFRFGIVEKNLYRGACPTARNYPFLRTLQLKTIISLLPSKPPTELVNFCASHAIQSLHYEVPKFKGDVTLAPYVIAELLEVLIDMENHPVYVHCLDGGNNTGMVIACLRKLQNWSGMVIGAEFTRFLKAKDAHVSADEQDFIDAFHSAVRLPALIPHWLWHGVPVSRHPTIPLKITPATHSLPVQVAEQRDDSAGPPRRVLSAAEAASHSLQALDMAGFQSVQPSAVPLTDFRLGLVSAPATPVLSRRAPHSHSSHPTSPLPSQSPSLSSASPSPPLSSHSHAPSHHHHPSNPISNTPSSPSPVSSSPSSSSTSPSPSASLPPVAATNNGSIPLSLAALLPLRNPP